MHMLLKGMKETKGAATALHIYSSEATWRGRLEDHGSEKVNCRITMAMKSTMERNHCPGFRNEEKTVL